MKAFTLALFAVLFALTASAGPPLNSQPNIRTAIFVGEPTVVAVNVIDHATNLLVETDAAATKVDVPSYATALWEYDLATATGYPTGCTPATYTVVFIPDSVDCKTGGGDPSKCAYDTAQVGGSACGTTAAVVIPDSPTTTKATSVVSLQGITNNVLNWYTSRGSQPVMWEEVRASSAFDYDSPDSITWNVYFYRDHPQQPYILCTVETAIDPNSALPSAVHCGF